MKTSHSEDGETRGLMDRVASGDRVAAAAVFEGHHDAVYRYLRGMGMDRATAEDVTQDVFMTAMGRADSYRGTGSLAGWLIRIARTTALDQLRSTSARRDRERSWAEEQAAVHEREGPAGPSCLVSRMLRALPPDDREIIVLAKFLGLCSSRVAEILDISPGAARVRLHRALRRFANNYPGLERS